MNATKAPSRTGRSHEENQERAYIAASRRADRSIEARLQSARMASDIHRKRTGRGFRITEEIVIKEEMYEEEEDELPRSLRALGPAVNTATAEFNWRVQAYMTNKIALASMAAGLSHEQWMAAHPTNRAFAESFPTHDLKPAERRASMAHADGAPVSELTGSPGQPELMAAYATPPPQAGTLGQLPDRRHSTPALSRVPSQHPTPPAPATPTFRQLSMTPTQLHEPQFVPDAGAGANHMDIADSPFTGEPSPDLTQMIDLMRFNGLSGGYSQGGSPAQDLSMFADLDDYPIALGPTAVDMATFPQDNFMAYETDPIAHMGYGVNMNSCDMFPSSNNGSAIVHHDDIQWTSYVNLE